MNLQSQDVSVSPGRFVWSAGLATVRRNAYMLFVREFELDQAPSRATIGLCADNRYMLRVNGQWVASGPGRFMPESPVYDTWCLRSWLCAGSNRIEVIVHAALVSTFQTDPRAVGGFAAGGDIETDGTLVSLETPGAWCCRPMDAWRTNAPAFSFALGPVEVCDTRILRYELSDRTGFTPVQVVAGPWGKPSPREVPPPDFRLSEPVAVSGPAEWIKAESVMTFTLAGRSRKPSLRYAVKTWIRAPAPGVRRFAAFWLHPRVNGVRIQGEDDPLTGGRTNYEAHFNEGWNLLTGYVDALTEFWTVQLAFERADGLEVGVDRIEGDRRALAVAGPLTDSQAACLESEEAANADAWTTPDLEWTPLASDLLAGAPSRRTAWARPARMLPRFAPLRDAVRMHVDETHGAILVLDWEGGFLGQLKVEVEAPAGTIMDVAWGETLREDGCLSLYRANPRIESADRFVLAGGRQSVEGFCVRGGRYIQLNFDLTDGGSGEIVLHHVAVRRMNTPLEGPGMFSCDSPLWNWLWNTGRATLQACMEDVYVDCPWRERGLYIADAWADARLQRLISSDHSITRHCLRLIAQGQLPDGQLNAVVPSWYQTALEDFSLTWILFLRDHWAWTGDIALVDELWPTLVRVLDSESWRFDEHGLLDATDSHVFVDWGATPTAKTGRGNTCLNAFRIEALRAAAELADATGRHREARDLARKQARALSAFRRMLFDPGEGRFRCSLEEPTDAAADSLHANVLALAFDLAPSGQREGVLDFVLSELEKTIRQPLSAVAPRIELFFLNYVLDVLYAEGKSDEAMQIVEACYGGMKDREAVTFWETLRRGAVGEGSQCHAWSAAAAQACVTRVIGLRPAVPGRTDAYVISPAPGTLRRAECVFPHPRGEIRVSLLDGKDGPQVFASGPEGVKLSVVGREMARPVTVI